MKLIFLYFIVALCFFCKDGEALFFRLKSETQKRESGHSLLSSLSFGDANKRKTSLVGSLPNNGFRAQGAAEDGSREPRDADSLELDVVPAGATSSSDYSSSGPFSTPEKGSHIPEATPKYSETDAIIGEASTWGKGAYKAFNGRVFSFESSCSYTFCRHCVESGGDFNVEIKRNNDSEIEKITVIIDNNDISISGDVILVNGESVHIPYNNKLIHIKKYGEHNVLNSRRGILSLMWDKNNKLSLTIHKQYPTCGLCGNFNNTPGEDIDEHIANSKIPGNCPNAVSKSYELCEDGVQHCEKIIGTYFEKCQKVSSLSNDYKIICIDEYCQNRDAKSTCDTYSELSRLCASDGPGVYESWRDDSAVVCEKPNCPEKHIYKECGPSNPATCSNVAPFQDSECVSGCTCPEGYLLDDIGKKGKCVLKAYCPCESNGNVYQSGEVREGPCGSQCTCQEAKWSCTEALCPGRCKVEGSLITTFDGVKYNHPGNCHFLAIHDKDWSISVELRPCQSGQSGTCLNSVTLLLNSSVSVDKYIFNRDGTVTNDKIRNQSYYYSDKVQIFKVSSSYLQAETYFHVKMQIQIVPVMQLYVSMPPNQFTDTVGLCGSYNNRAEDDFMSSQNILEKTSQAFANSWEMMSCSKGNTASCISIEKEKFAEKNCGILLDSSGPFASCHPIVNPKPYHEECKKYTCACENSKDCLCTILGNYVKACAEKETYIVGWRAELCDHSCPSGLVFKYNVKACNSSCRSLSERDRSCDVEDVPIDGCTCPDGMYHNNEGTCVPKSQCDCYINDEVMQPGKLIHIGNNKCVCRDGILLCQTPIDLTLQNCTGGAEYVDCRDPKAQRRADSTCSTWNIPSFEENLPCKRGCYCPVGMVRNSKGNCVFPEDCPCSFGGREYDQGSVTSVGCNKCTCIKGSWNCTQNECQTTCHIYGEGHIRTFDGKTYSFDGLCQYSFLEDYCGSENGTFRILTESVPCCEDGLTCSRKIIVAFQDQNVVLHDGKVTAVKTTESKECELEENSYSVHTVGLYLILKFLSGITIIWDKNTRISVILDPRWNGKVCGLCGNNNGDLKDDFTTRYSSVAVGELEFGNSWKTSQECSDTVTQSFPCDSNPYCKAWAVRKCEIIRDSTFRDCHNKVDPSAYYDACIEEACACDMEGKYLGFCTAVAMYAEACSAVGVCVTWRKPDLCPVYCDYYNAPGECSWRYEPCGTVTAKTCKDRVIGQKFSALLEGCYAKCPDSAPYLDENTMKCVSLSECSCFYNDIIPAGGVIQDNCGRICYCIAGELECSESALTNSTFTVSTTTATSILSTEAAITLVTSSSSTAASIPAITTSSSGTIGTTLSFLSETFTTGAPGVSEGVTTVSGNKSTSEDSAAPGTTPEGPPGTTGGENAATTGAAGEDTSGASGTTGTSVVSSETSGGAETTGPSAEKSRTTLPTIGMTEIIGSSTEESRATRPSTGRYSPNVSSAVGSQTSRQSTEGSSENGPTEVVTDIYLQSTGISRTTEELGSTGISVIGSGKTGSSTILTVTSARSSVAGSGTTRTVSGASGSTGSSSGSPGATRASIGQPETSRISVAGSSGAPAVSSGASQAAGTSGAGPGTTASSVGVTETARPSVAGSGTTGTVSGASGSTGSSSGSPGATGASIGQPETSRISVAGSSGAPAVSSGASQAAGTSEATTSIEGAGTSGVGFKTEATTFPGENETTRVGIATGTTGIVSRKTLEPGSYNTEATTSIGRSGTTHTDLPGGTTIVLPGFSHSSQSSKPGSSVTTPGSPESGSETGTSGEFSTTVISGSSHTEATTFIGGSGSPGTGSRPGTTGELSGTTIASGNATTEATTSTETRIGPQTGTSEAVSNPAIASGSSSTGTTSGASDSQVTGSRTGTTGVVLGTTVAPGSSSTGATTGVLINEGTRSTSLGTTRVASGTTYESGTSNSESIVPSGGSGTPGSGINTGGSSTQVTGIQTGTTAVGFGSTLLPGSSNTGATTSPSERTSPGSKTGITRVVSGTTVASGSSNTGATTSLGRGETTQGGIKIVITGVTVGTTVAPGSFNTKATTPTEVRAATGAGTAVGATSRSTGISTGPENSTPGTTETGSGTTSSPGGVKTEATTFKGVGTTEAGISSGNSPGSGGVTSSQEGTSREASETTTAPRISATGSTSVSKEITASPKVSSPETTAGATEDQENENKTGCPAPLPPPPVCHGPLGEEKSPGDVWTANCHKCTCTEAKTVDCKPKECPSPPTCKTGERLIKFKANDTCCEIGHCEKRTCLFNNTDYEVGSSFDDPNNPCVTYSCQNTGFTAVVQNCPKQTWCAEEDRVYDSKQCCYTCKSSCKPSPVNVTVRYNGCTIKVEMARCVGECKKTVTYDYDIFQLKNSCLCCQEEDYEFRDIVLDCPDGSTLPYRYRHITACSCLDPCQQSMT